MLRRHVGTAYDRAGAILGSRPHYGRRAVAADGSDVAPDVTGHRHGRRVRTLTGTFGKTEIAVPRARLNTAEGEIDLLLQALFFPIDFDMI